MDGWIARSSPDQHRSLLIRTAAADEAPLEESADEQASQEGSSSSSSSSSSDDVVAEYTKSDADGDNEELQLGDWRVERARLEEHHNRAIRQRKRRFLPYVDACMWARRMGFSSKEEWDEWISLGEKRTPYITRDPQKYYSEMGTWRGWDHFLGVSQLEGGEPFQIETTEEHSEVD